MSFTNYLRKKSAKFELEDYRKIAWDQSDAFKRRLDSEEKGPYHSLNPKRCLSWKNLTSHTPFPPPKAIKESFYNILHISESTFPETPVSLSSFAIFRIFLSEITRNKNFVKNAKKELKLNPNQIEDLKNDSLKVLEWHLNTGGKFYSNLNNQSKSKKINKSKIKRSYGKDYLINFPFEIIEIEKEKEKENKNDMNYQKGKQIYKTEVKEGKVSKGTHQKEGNNKKDKTIKKYSAEWLYKRCSGVSQPQITVSQIVEIVNSDKNNEEIQDSLFDSLGESNVGLICEIISHRKVIQKQTKMFFAKEPGIVNQDMCTSYEHLQRMGASSINDSILLPERTEHYIEDEIEEFYIPSRKKEEIKGVFKDLSEIDEGVVKIFKDIDTFNKMQSICFDTAYKTSENMLICAPTGAGKTNVALLAIARQIHVAQNSAQTIPVKMVYVTPMKALAAEMANKFSSKLRPIGITCAEFTGDMRLSAFELSKTDLIVTTPEKWDVVTRKESQVVKEVRLLIIDEVHLLNEDRGPVIECIVSRTKMFIEKSQLPVRIVGLSATLPNYKDVATFLGVNVNGLFHFGDEYRPVPLSHRFVGVSGRNFFTKKKLMEEVCVKRVKETLRLEKQIIIFVHSRKETLRTARTVLETILEEEAHLIRLCKDNRLVGKVYDNQLKNLIRHGFGTHNAGMCRHDRSAMERMFCSGMLRVLVSTATLAWGVNLPAHTVVIKDTSIYNPEKGQFVDIGGLDVIQIFGRAGRPQFDNSGEGVLITTKKLLPKYIRILTSQIPIESKLTTDVENNLNAEIVSGTVTNVTEAINWLAYTYLFIRMLRNPLMYGIPYEEANIDKNLINRRRSIIYKAAEKLSKSRIIRFDKKTAFFPTNLGRISSHFYIHFESIKTFMETIWKSGDYLPREEILVLVAKSKEFEQIRVRDEEQNELESFEIPVQNFKGNDERIVKTSILIQAYITRCKVKSFTLSSDMHYVSQNIGRITRALFEICLNENKPNLAKSFLDLCKMAHLRVWEDEHPLSQYGILSNDLLEKMKKRNVTVEKLLEEDNLGIIGMLISNQKKAPLILNLARSLPFFTVIAKARPITQTILKINIELMADFIWNEKYHGQRELFWVLLEDTSQDSFVHYKDSFSLSKKSAIQKENNSIEFIISLQSFKQKMPSQFVVRVLSDKWLHTDQSVPLPFKHLILPGEKSSQTELMDLHPLPVSCLNNPLFESFFSFKHFNRIQTQVFHIAFHTDLNILLGAPTGSGKTCIVELAVFRILKKNGTDKIVYIAPLKALAREKYRDWSEKFGSLGLKVSMLTGDNTPEPRELLMSKILIATPEKWDGVSRDWRNRRYVKTVSLVLIDEIHLLGTERGGVIEAIISRIRYISKNTEKHIRIVGLSTALANARDLGDWLGIGPIGLYNFHNDLRSIPLEIHVAGYPGKHYCPRMNAMNKPCFQAIMTHSKEKPALVFVSSRRQTRLTAFDLINFLAMQGDSQKWLKVSHGEMAGFLEKIKDESLKKCLEFGIGIHHAGLIDEDRKIVENLFTLNLIQVLVCTATLAWGVNFPAHLVVVKGTEYYEAKSKRYVELPLTDVLQMVGRAGRPGFDETGVACILVKEEKKPFYLKFLHEPFPLESSLHEQLHNHLNAEISSGEVKNREDAMEYMESTFLFRRVKGNPSFYGVESAQQDLIPSEIKRYFENIIESTLNDLAAAKCVQIESKTVSPSKLGRIASFYYIDYKTASLFSGSLVKDASFGDILRLLSSAREFDELPMRHNEDKVNEELAQKVELSCGEMSLSSPASKVFLLLQSHMQRVGMPICDYETDLRSVLDQSIRLLQALLDVAAMKRFYGAMAKIINVLQHIVQGVWFGKGFLNNLPFLSEKNLNVLDRFSSLEQLKQKGTLAELCGMSKSERSNFYEKIGINSVVKKNAMERYIERLPFAVKVDFRFCRSKEGREVNGTVEVRDGSYKGSIFAPKWPKPRKNSWFILIGRKKDLKSVYFARVKAVKRVKMEVSFMLDDSLVEEICEYELILMTDSFVGFDQVYEFSV